MFIARIITLPPVKIKITPYVTWTTVSQNSIRFGFDSDDAISSSPISSSFKPQYASIAPRGRSMYISFIGKRQRGRGAFPYPF